MQFVGLARAFTRDRPLVSIHRALWGDRAAASIRAIASSHRQRASGDATDHCAILHVSGDDRAGAHERRFADCDAGRHHYVTGDDGPGSDDHRFEAIMVVVAGRRLDVLGCVEHRVRPDEHSTPAAKASQTVEGGVDVDADLLRESNAPWCSDVDSLSDRHAATKLGEERAVADAAKAHAERSRKGTQERMHDVPQLLTASRRSG